MKIVILSDSHSFPLPKILLEECHHSDAIIHAGDICDQETLSLLKTIAPVYAVCGNMCESSIKKQLPKQQVVALEGLHVGICHGHEGESRDAFENARNCFKDSQVDVVVFGHSHKVCQQQIGKVLYLNPGSPNDHIKAAFCSYMVAMVSGKKISVVVKKC